MRIWGYHIWYHILYGTMTLARDPKQCFLISQRRNHERGIIERGNLEEESWKSSHGGGRIMGEESGIICRHLDFWEASGSIWEASGRHLEPSGRHLGGIWRHLEASGDTQEAPRRHPEAPRRHPGGTQEARWVLEAKCAKSYVFYCRK